MTKDLNICFIGSRAGIGGSNTQFKNDVTSLRKKCNLTVLEDNGFPLDTSYLKQFDGILCTSLDIANQITENPELIKKTILFINGRADYLFDPGKNENRKVALAILPILKLVRKVTGRRMYTIRKLISKYLTGIDPIILETLLKFDRVYVPSNFWGKILKKEYNVNYTKIPHGIDKKYWLRNVPKKLKNGQKIRICIPTGFFFCKQLDYGLDKIDKLVTNNPNIEADFIWYNTEYQSLFPVYQKKYSHISFLLGTHDPKKFLSKYDLVVHPSLGDTFCQVVLECFALGLPVIASSISEDLRGNQVIYIDPRSEKFSTVVSRIVKNPDERSRLGRAAKKFAKEWITWDQRARMVIGILKAF